VYGATEIEEKYNCSFGLNKDFQNQLDHSGFKVVGTDEKDEARIMLIQQNHFFVATLFQPQLSSTFEKPHPLIMAYLTSVKEFSMRNK
jgi:CTP synthase (UTP-ammonia lyase)